MILSIITINRNNRDGLKKTIDSVLCQTRRDFEFVIVDGSSTDGSVDVIKEAEAHTGDISLNWKSEPDSGIYNAMNKGIERASGKYLQFLNSGDFLAGPDVVEKMCMALNENGFPPIMTGNEIKFWPDGRKFRNDSKYLASPQTLTMQHFYRSTVNHSPSWIKKELFDEFGYYDENYGIVSDWEWFLKVVVFGDVQPVSVDVDAIMFDMTGVSETNSEQVQRERRQVLEKLLPKNVLADYDANYWDINTIQRLRRHPVCWKIVSLIERICFKIEKINIRRRCYFR